MPVMFSRIFSFSFLLLLAGCTQAQQPFRISPADFAAKMALPGITLLDVRTPEEFDKGHLAAARNMDWNSGQFPEQMKSLDKAKPVLVYCASGRRSAAAAASLRSAGFREVLELDGGIVNWRAAGLPEVTGTAGKGMTRAEFDHLTADKTILVDFYADWCAPCKKMKPWIDEIAAEMKSKVSVIRINADDNVALCKELKIAALPVLQVYKGGDLSWNHTGLAEKEEILKQLR